MQSLMLPVVLIVALLMCTAQQTPVNPKQALFKIQDTFWSG
jgi:hypothetical protein